MPLREEGLNFLMRILQITNKIPYPENDGGAIACMNVLRGLHFAGHDVTLLSMVTLKHPISIDDIPLEIRNMSDIRLVDVPAPITIWGAFQNLIFSKLPYNAVRFISKPFASELKKILLEKEFDLIQLEGLYVCPYIPEIRKVSHAKIVYRAHNIEHEIWQRTANLAKGFRKWYLNILNKRLRKFEESLINSYDLLIPITERDREILNKLGNTQPAHVSQTGIDLSKLIHDDSTIEFSSIFHIGSLDWAPNQEGLLWFLENCWPEIIEKKPDVKFYIAGRNAPAWLVKKFDNKNVFFEGEVKDAYKFMNSKAIMIVPLLSGSGMRIKIIEGMALGKSIVSTTIGTEGILSSSGENILIADSAKDFTEQVLILMENKGLYKKIGRNAIQFIHKNFNNLAITERLAEFYLKHLE